MKVKELKATLSKLDDDAEILYVSRISMEGKDYLNFSGFDVACQDEILEVADLLNISYESKKIPPGYFLIAKDECLVKE